VEAEGEVTACGPGLRWDPASPQPLIKVAAEIKAVMTMVLVDLYQFGAGRVVNEVDVVVVAGMRLLQALNDEAQYSLAELVEGQVERFRRCGR
jgi:hypothetical protein